MQKHCDSTTVVLMERMHELVIMTDCSTIGYRNAEAGASTELDTGSSTGEYLVSRIADTLYMHVYAS